MACEEDTPKIYLPLCEFLSTPSDLLPLPLVDKVHQLFPLEARSVPAAPHYCSQVRKLPVDEGSMAHWQSLVYGPLNGTYSIARNAWPVVTLDQAWLSHYERMLDEPFKMVRHKQL